VFNDFLFFLRLHTVRDFLCPAFDKCIVPKYVCINTELLGTYTCWPFGFNKDQLVDIPELLASKFNSAKLAKKFSTYMEYEDSAPRTEQPPLYNILSHLQSVTYRHSFQNYPSLFCLPGSLFSCTCPIPYPSWRTCPNNVTYKPARDLKHRFHKFWQL